MDEFKVTTTFARCHNQINQLENNNNSKASKPKGDSDPDPEEKSFKYLNKKTCGQFGGC